jgi:hypothetical protein
MQYPHVTEMARAGRMQGRFPRSPRELVELSLRVNPTRTARPNIERGQSRGISR